MPRPKKKGRKPKKKNIKKAYTTQWNVRGELRDVEIIIYKDGTRETQLKDPKILSAKEGKKGIAFDKALEIYAKHLAKKKVKDFDKMRKAEKRQASALNSLKKKITESNMSKEDVLKLLGL